MSLIYVGRLSRAARREAPLIAPFRENHAALGECPRSQQFTLNPTTSAKNFGCVSTRTPIFISAHFELI
jgi:hypothetical protein